MSSLDDLITQLRAIQDQGGVTRVQLLVPGAVYEVGKVTVEKQDGLSTVLIQGR